MLYFSFIFDHKSYQMLKKIKLINFMSHKCSELELAEGVNVLTGPNNSGKSAVVTALKLLTELPTKEGAYMMRHGEKETQVIVETGEGDKITWGRKDSFFYLIINDKKHIRSSKDQSYYLNELHKVLRLPEVANNDDTFDIHFACQKDPIFLLNDPPRRAATFFSASSDAGRLVELRRVFKNKVSSAKDKLKDRKEKEKASLQELEQLAPLDNLKTNIDNLKPTFDSLKQDSQKIKDGFDLLQNLKDRLRELALLSKKQSIFEEIKPPPKTESTEYLEGVICRIKQETVTRHSLLKKNKLLKKLKTVPNVFEVKRLDKIIDLLKTTKKEENLKSQALSILQTLSEPPSAVGSTPLLIQSIQNLDRHKDSIDKHQQNLTTTSVALQEWIAENPHCPTCGGVLNSEHLSEDLQHV